MARSSQASDRLVIDFGAHLHPTDPEEFQAFREFIEESDGSAIHSEMNALAARYEESGIDGAVLSSPFFMGNGDLDRVETGNDELLKTVNGWDNYYALAGIPTAAGGEEAAAEFERCLNAGFNGGALETKTDGIELHDPEVEPILEVADQTGAPILVHPKLNESLHPDALDDTWRLNAIFGREVALAESICKVVHTGVLDRYPNLNLVYHHTAGNIASMMGRIALQLDEGRWPGMEDVVGFDEFKSQVEERIYLDSSGYYGRSSPFRTTLEEFPSSQLLFGSDFPYETRVPEVFDKIVSSIDEVSSDADTRRILSDNALDLLVNV
ncbi:amidohydrolase family protein [Halobellus rubicundus]|uniref:Amidohydrolase family protein n=1 Tax=Halobellus rubicundus TaxID=2996466 RepID=A0ABD5M763_9EURY